MFLWCKSDPRCFCDMHQIIDVLCCKSSHRCFRGVMKYLSPQQRLAILTYLFNQLATQTTGIYCLLFSVFVTLIVYSYIANFSCFIIFQLKIKNRKYLSIYLICRISYKNSCDVLFTILQWCYLILYHEKTKLAQNCFRYILCYFICTLFNMYLLFTTAL